MRFGKKLKIRIIKLEFCFLKKRTVIKIKRFKFKKIKGL